MLRSWAWVAGLLIDGLLPMMIRYISSPVHWEISKCQIFFYWSYIQLDVVFQLASGEEWRREKEVRGLTSVGGLVYNPFIFNPMFHPSSLEHLWPSALHISPEEGGWRNHLSAGVQERMVQNVWNTDCWRISIFSCKTDLGMPGASKYSGPGTSCLTSSLFVGTVYLPLNSN